MVGLRLFHGAFGPLSTNNLRLRTGGVTSSPIAYGVAPGPVDDAIFAGASGGATLQVIDAGGAVVATQSGVELLSGRTYLAVLSRGPDGSSMLLSIIDENVVDLD